MDDPNELEVRTTADGSRTLFDRSVGQTYHSERGARTETQHVFLHGSGLLGRLQAGETVHVVEVGLGTGANLLATWDAVRTGGARLHYRALELRPPPVDAVRALRLDVALAHPTLAASWLDVLAELRRDHDPDAAMAPAWHAFAPSADLRLEVALGDATLAADGGPSGAAARALAPGWAHAIYHDAFSRDATPSLWTAPFLSACARALAPGGAWVSYSVAGEVRRQLETAGLVVEKRPGPAGGKREMLYAERPA